MKNVTVSYGSKKSEFFLNTLKLHNFSRIFKATCFTRCRLSQSVSSAVSSTARWPPDTWPKYVKTSSYEANLYIAEMFSLAVLDRSVEGERIAALPDLIEPVSSTFDWRVLRLWYRGGCWGFLYFCCLRLLCWCHPHWRCLWAEEKRLNLCFWIPLFFKASC